jgi:hypothetical protein
MMYVQKIFFVGWNMTHTIQNEKTVLKQAGIGTPAPLDLRS